MKKLKNLIGVLSITLLVSLGIGNSSVGATSWSVSHANYPGAPSSEGVAKSIIVKHRAAGAKATCNYSTHSNVNATTGYTYISCENYSMTRKSIKNLNYVICNPNVGSPISDISVRYRVSAYTPTSSDTYNSKGNIEKRS